MWIELVLALLCVLLVLAARRGRRQRSIASSPGKTSEPPAEERAAAKPAARRGEDLEREPAPRVSWDPATASRAYAYAASASPGGQAHGQAHEHPGGSPLAVPLDPLAPIASTPLPVLIAAPAKAPASMEGADPGTETECTQLDLDRLVDRDPAAAPQWPPPLPTTPRRIPNARSLRDWCQDSDASGASNASDAMPPVGNVAAKRKALGSIFPSGGARGSKNKLHLVGKALFTPQNTDASDTKVMLFGYV